MTWKLKALIVSSACLSMANCTTMETMATGDEGRIHITADAEGMRAWSDMLASQAQIAKDDKNTVGPSWGLRDKQETVRSLRFSFKKPEGK